MLHLEKLNNAQVENVYKERMVIDFPKAELKPLDILYKAIDKGIYEPLGLFDETKLIGYTFLVKNNLDYLVDYLAVYPQQRNLGSGGVMVRLLPDYLKDAENIIAEIENPEYAENEDDKILQTKRFGFYTRNGCSDTGLRVRCFGVPFMILRWGTKESEDPHALWNLYQSFYRILLPKDMFEKNIKKM
ncbi:GNAT family N-acetyltransferase [Butyrivibrio sp. M55]|uniref:GNAT family N-acetyltransferase n=1 Tax=Butyrivibrio sp. M55 TaxID=1855323 RepID=UPI0008EC5D81|nr:GNAT family N-acetyltransferase [Butyrivibrio sp. M55]SFU44718.1 hypothetical protein SAMN05216540_102197 [Butyrivibrio sp. M55]